MHRLKELFWCAISFCMSVSALGQDMVMFRADARHSGIYDTVGLAKYSKVKWKFHTGGQVISSPAVVGDTLYVGSTDHNLYAINLDSGTLKWKFKTGGRVNFARGRWWGGLFRQLRCVLLRG
jgi:hypothetical protein